jgi:hypothetical protein
MTTEQAFDLYMTLSQDDANISAVNLNPDSAGGRKDGSEKSGRLWCCSFGIHFEKLGEPHQRAMMFDWCNPEIAAKNRMLKLLAIEGMEKLDGILPDDVRSEGYGISRALFS